MHRQGLADSARRTWSHCGQRPLTSPDSIPTLLLHPSTTLG